MSRTKRDLGVRTGDRNAAIRGKVITSLPPDVRARLKDGLGLVSDKQLAEDFNLPTRSVRAMRIYYGIPCCPQPHSATPTVQLRLYVLRALRHDRWVAMSVAEIVEVVSQYKHRCAVTPEGVALVIKNLVKEKLVERTTDDKWKAAKPPRDDASGSTLSRRHAFLRWPPEKLAAFKAAWETKTGAEIAAEYGLNIHTTYCWGRVLRARGEKTPGIARRYKALVRTREAYVRRCERRYDAAVEKRDNAQRETAYHARMCAEVHSAKNALTAARAALARCEEDAQQLSVQSAHDRAQVLRMSTSAVEVRKDAIAEVLLNTSKPYLPMLAIKEIVDKQLGPLHPSQYARMLRLLLAEGRVGSLRESAVRKYGNGHLAVWWSTARPAPARYVKDENDDAV